MNESTTISELEEALDASEAENTRLQEEIERLRGTKTQESLGGESHRRQLAEKDRTIMRLTQEGAELRAKLSQATSDAKRAGGLASQVKTLEAKIVEIREGHERARIEKTGYGPEADFEGNFDFHSLLGGVEDSRVVNIKRGTFADLYNLVRKRTGDPLSGLVALAITGHMVSEVSKVENPPPGCDGGDSVDVWYQLVAGLKVGLKATLPASAFIKHTRYPINT